MSPHRESGLRLFSPWNRQLKALLYKWTIQKQTNSVSISDPKYEINLILQTAGKIFKEQQYFSRLLKLSDIWKGESAANIWRHISRHIGLQVWNAPAPFIIFKSNKSDEKIWNALYYPKVTCLFQQPASMANSAIFCCFPAHSCSGENAAEIYFWNDI